MAVEERVYQDDVGTIIKIDMQEIITGATDLKFYVRKPQGGEEVWTPTIDPDDPLSCLIYTVQAGEQDEVGIYKIQPALTLSGWTGRGNTINHKVYEKFS